MTPLEREEDDALYQEMKRRRELSKNEGDHHAVWIRRRGEVVNIGRYPRDHGPRGSEGRK